MKLLFDQNVSPKLVARLADLFPDSAHVFSLGLDTADDMVVWEFARANHFVIVSKDEDFNLHSVRLGSPPKVIWLVLGNCSTSTIEVALQAENNAIQAFANDPQTSTLVIR